MLTSTLKLNREYLGAIQVAKIGVAPDDDHFDVYEINYLGATSAEDVVVKIDHHREDSAVDLMANAMVEVAAILAER